MSKADLEKTICDRTSHVNLVLKEGLRVGILTLSVLVIIIIITIRLLSLKTVIEVVWPYLSIIPCFQHYSSAPRKSAPRCSYMHDCFSGYLYVYLSLTLELTTKRSH